MAELLSIHVNSQMLELESSSLVALFEYLGQPTRGVAVAVNENVVHRKQWSEFKLQNGDQVLLFESIAGG